jgi:exosortase family protein XrtF
VLFLGTYLILSVLYGLYLNISQGSTYPPDVITNLVAKQSSDVISSFGYSARVIPDPKNPFMQLYVEGKFLARIIEGCNAVSIIILFISFVIAFSETIKKTVLFIFAGAALIYAVNILRIVILAISLYEFPEQKELLHGVVFPGLIYGMVFILWMIWIRSLKTAEKNE